MVFAAWQPHVPLLFLVYLPHPDIWLQLTAEGPGNGGGRWDAG